MADDTSTATVTINFSTGWKIFFAITALLYCAVMATWITVWGNPANSLHQSALSWCFMMGGGILAGVGFGALAPLIQLIKK